MKDKLLKYWFLYAFYLFNLLGVLAIALVIQAVVYGGSGILIWVGALIGLDLGILILYDRLLASYPKLYIEVNMEKRAKERKAWKL